MTDHPRDDLMFGKPSRLPKNRVQDSHQGVVGFVSQTGDVTGLAGDVAWLAGDVAWLTGDVTGLTGDVAYTSKRGGTHCQGQKRSTKD